MIAGYIPYRYSAQCLQDEPCEGCTHYIHRDCGYGPYEEHDYYCTLRREWRPIGCNEYEPETQPEEIYEDEE